MTIHSIRQEIKGVLVFIGVIWLVFLLDFVLTPFDLGLLGIQPRSLTGLVGVASAPFLHRDLWHLIGNTVPLLLLLSLLAGSRATTHWVVTAIVLVGGGLLWLAGPGDTNHIGASLLVFGLIAFHIAAGFFERRPLSILIALLVGMFYGTTLLNGILPRPDSQISWQGHLFGALAGVAVAYGSARIQESKRSRESAGDHGTGLQISTNDKSV
jgi:membrane associated rhomboid family serine protease